MVFAPRTPVEVLLRDSAAVQIMQIASALPAVGLGIMIQSPGRELERISRARVLRSLRLWFALLALVSAALVLAVAVPPSAGHGSLFLGCLRNLVLVVGLCLALSCWVRRDVLLVVLFLVLGVHWLFGTTNLEATPAPWAILCQPWHASLAAAVSGCVVVVGLGAYALIGPQEK
jgi:hypothetical protein